MKTLLVATGVLLTLSVAGLNSLQASTKGGKRMTQADVLTQVTSALEGHAELKLKKVSCKFLYGDEAPQSRRCYAAPLEPEVISGLLAKALMPVANTNGWTTDYDVPGAFYQMKADTKMTFGLTVKRIQGSLDFEGVKELEGQASYVTVTANAQRKP